MPTRQKTHLLPMVRQDTSALQMPVDAYGISGRSENVCIRTSLVAAAGISERLMKS